MSRPRKIAIGALIVLLAAAPFVPRGSDEDGSVTPIGDGETGALATSATAGAGRVTPEMQAEIDRVVAQSRAAGRMSTKLDPSSLAASLVRCADFEGQRYCLGTGWTERSEADVQARVATAARTVAARPTGAAEATGDLDAARRTAADGRPRPGAAGGGRAARADPGCSVGGEGVAPASRDRGGRTPCRLRGRAPGGGGRGGDRHRRGEGEAQDHQGLPRSGTSCCAASTWPSRSAPTGAARPPCR